MEIELKAESGSKLMNSLLCNSKGYDLVGACTVPTMHFAAYMVNNVWFRHISIELTIYLCDWFVVQFYHKFQNSMDKSQIIFTVSVILKDLRISIPGYAQAGSAGWWL